MTETTIPLNKLTPWSGNVRKTGAEDGIGELIASIAAHGLLQSLVARKTARGKFAVIAGGRRYLALTALARDGKIAADLGVPCHIVSQDADAVELSLAENVVRTPMHPADQFEAFRDLIDRGASAADVAARFGVSESIVVKRMKLGRVAPALLAVYRAGSMSLEQVQAFTISDDHAAQERAWVSAYARQPQAIRRVLTEGEIPTSDKRVRFVTLDAYEAAGGAVRWDLFDDRGGYVQDVALLDQLVQERLAAAAETVRSEGWAWVEARIEFDWQAREAFRRVRPDQADFTDAEGEELDQLAGERITLEEQVTDDDVDADDPSVAARIAAIEARIDEITERPDTFPADVYNRGGAVVTINHDGDLEVRRGLIRPEDASDGTSTGRKSARSPDALPASLVEALTAHKTAALQAELIARPEVALAAVVHALVLRAFYHYAADSSVGIASKMPQLRAAETSKAAAYLAAEHDRWASQLPENADDAWVWCLEQPRDVLFFLLAFTAAQTVDAVQHKADNPGDGRLAHAEALARTLKLDMATWFTPTADNYFGRIGKAAIAAAIVEMSPTYGVTTFAKEKKAALAAIAERQVAGTGWLPVPLRIADDQSTDAVEIAAELDKAA